MTCVMTRASHGSRGKWNRDRNTTLVEGAPFFGKSLAWYSAMQVVRMHYGKEQLRRLA